MASVFTKIIQKEIPGYIIAETEDCIAFLDVFPLALGHVLVVPKQEVDKLFDLDESVYLKLMAFSKEVATALEKAVPCKRVGVAVIGLEVPHAHVHLIPLQSVEDINFSRPKMQFSEQEMREVQNKIIAELNK
ncbi:MAG: HIT family protein [Flavobacteriaceae bacterium]|nr:MAG: HIT family protein [Flavobacteriaceae bacterium]